MRDGPLSGKHIDKNNGSFILLPSVDARTSITGQLRIPWAHMIWLTGVVSAHDDSD